VIERLPPEKLAEVKKNFIHVMTMSINQIFDAMNEKQFDEASACMEILMDATVQLKNAIEREKLT
jgi:hypothetical protein